MNTKPISLEIRINELPVPKAMPELLSEAAAYEKLWADELHHCNYFYAVIVDTSAEPHQHKAVNSPPFLREAPSGLTTGHNTRKSAVWAMFDMICQQMIERLKSKESA